MGRIESGLHIDPEGSGFDIDNKKPEARVRYEARREQAEQHFLNTKPEVVEIKGEEGERVRVFEADWVVPKNLKKDRKDGKLRLTLYVPGMFQTDQPNMGNYPLETKLGASMLTGDSDAIVMVKAEGLNKQAYVDNEGAGRCQSFVAEKATEVLAKKIKKIKADLDLPEETEVEVEVVGYSEGATQGASIAENILEKKIGKVTEYISIGGSGLSGEVDQTEVSPLKHIASNRKKLTDLPEILHDSKGEPAPFEHRKAEDTILVRKNMFGSSREKGGYEQALGEPANVSMAKDIRNVGLWFGRHLLTKMGVTKEVPNERVQAVFTVNRDYAKLSERGVPITVLAGTRDILFPASDIEENVKILRQKGGRVLLIESDTAHPHPHENPSGTALGIELFQSKAGFKE